MTETTIWSHNRSQSFNLKLPNKGILIMYFREVRCDHVKCTPADFNHNPGMRSVDPAFFFLSPQHGGRKKRSITSKTTPR